MKNFNWEEFRNKNVAVWCDTEEKANDFLKECHERGMTWCSGDNLIEENMHGIHKNDTCYFYNFSKKILNSNRCDEVGYARKDYYKDKNCKIIKWELEECNVSKFKVGDKVILSDGRKWCGDIDYRVVLEVLGNASYKLSDGAFTWHDDELELYKEQEEFTFEEVISRIKKGEIYKKVKGFSCLDKIEKLGDGINLIFDEETSVLTPTANKFKLIQQKEKYTLYEVEHQEGGKRYLFRSNLDHTLDDMVICQTKFGKSYGKMVKRHSKELTEEEYKQYSPIVKIISKGCPF